MSVQLKPAPVWKRILAFAVDVAIVEMALGLVILCLLFFFGSALGFLATLFRSGMKGMVSSKSGATILILMALVSFLILISIFDGFFIYFEWKKGATPGKRLLGLRVVPLDRTRLTLGQCALRQIMRWVDLGLILPGILSVVLTQKKQRLGDIVAGTIVSHSIQEEEKQKYFYVNQELYQWFVAKCSPNPPNSSDCETFLKFAYPTFALHSRNFSQFSRAEISRWEEYASQRVTGLNDLGVDREVKLKLFAELCFQTKTSISDENLPTRRQK
jgi:uncharacterized RDD family membrane protein YckC